MKKVKNTKNAEKMDYDTAFNIGWEAERAMIDIICSKISTSDDDAMETAAVASFQALAVRLLHLYDKEALIDILNNVEEEIDKDFEAFDDAQTRDKRNGKLN